jgi:hypothetical protein
VPQALRTTRIPVYVSDTTIQYLEDAAWVENPGVLFGRLLGETIAVRTWRVVLDARQYSQDPGTRITGQLHRFGLDPARMEVVVIYDATMPRGPGIVTNRFEARVPVAEATPAAVASALNQAANQAAEEQLGPPTSDVAGDVGYPIPQRSPTPQSCPFDRFQTRRDSKSSKAQLWIVNVPSKAVPRCRRGCRFCSGFLCDERVCPWYGYTKAGARNNNPRS